MARTYSQGPPAVLLVDDHPANLMALRAVLEPLGYELVDARSGKEAIQLSAEREFAVILMDVQMPELDGLETTNRIRSRPGSPVVPVIFITAFDRDATHARRGYECGAVDYLFKPIDTEILRSKVTVFVELHQQREQIRHQAEQLLAERLARVEAEAAIRAREDILGIVSHDLGNPITAINSYAHLLRKRGHATGDEEVERFAQRQLTAIDRMNRLLNDLLDASRLEGGQFSVEKERCDAADIVEQVVEILGPLARRKSQTLETATPRGTLVDCDRDRLHQVLSNLVGNAVKFTPEGGTISLRAESRPDETILTVCDEGPGISDQDLPHIFDRYWQASGPTRRGLGLGLAIAKGIVVAHGGRIWAESQRGKGSKFSLALPRSISNVVGNAHATTQSR